MRLILFLSKLLLFLNLICEDVKRPKRREDCFGRTFVGEYNESNAYCCYLKFNKFELKTLKCSVHFKDEIDNNAVFSTIDFLEEMNRQSRSKSDIQGISLDCKNNYIKQENIFIFLIIIFICL